jgi:hypothetical protein
MKDGSRARLYPLRLYVALAEKIVSANRLLLFPARCPHFIARIELFRAAPPFFASRETVIANRCDRIEGESIIRTASRRGGIKSQ